MVYFKHEAADVLVKSEHETVIFSQETVSKLISFLAMSHPE